MAREAALRFVVTEWHTLQANEALVAQLRELAFVPCNVPGDPSGCAWVCGVSHGQTIKNACGAHPTHRLRALSKALAPGQLRELAHMPRRAGSVAHSLLRSCMPWYMQPYCMQ